MALLGKFAASSVLLLVTTACASSALAQNQQEPATGAEAATSTEAQAEMQPQTGATEAAASAQDMTEPASSATTGQPTATPAPAGTSATGAPATGTAPAAYVPKTEHDNTPWRFNMKQDGKNMTADQFDAWLKSKGVRVATGKPATPLVQNCPTPEGDKGDNDGDRIINCLDKCPASQTGQTIGPDGCPVAVAIDLKGVTFGYDKAVLNDEAKKVLDEAVEILTRHPTLKVEVAGHTDSRGDAGYNQKLSERRAQAVYDYMVEAGIGEVRLIGPNGYGETRPLLPNENPDGSDNPANRAKNRRVELNIQN